MSTLDTLDVYTSVCLRCGGLRYIDHQLCEVCDGNGLILKPKPAKLGPLTAFVAACLILGASLWIGSILLEAIR